MEQGFFKFLNFLESVLYLNPKHCGTETTLQLQPIPDSFHILVIIPKNNVVDIQTETKQTKAKKKKKQLSIIRWNIYVITYYKCVFLMKLKNNYKIMTI